MASSLKTQPTEADVAAYLAGIPDERLADLDLDGLRQLVDRSVRVRHGVDRASRKHDPG